MKERNQANLKNPVMLEATLPQNVFTITKLYSTYSYFYSPRYVFRGESHEAWEFIYVQSGEVVVETDDYTQVLSKGQAFMHKPWEFHRIKANNTTCHTLFISFSVDHDEELYQIAGIPLQPNNTQKQYIYDIIDNGIVLFAGKNYVPPRKEGESEEFATNQTVKNLIELLLIGCIRNLENKAQKNSSSTQGEQAIVSYTIDFLNENLTKKLSLKDIANNLGYSVSHISNIFKKSMNVSLINYYIKLRIMRAHELIAEGKMSMKEISEYLDFDSVQYFSTQFKKITGITPTQYAAVIKMKNYRFDSFKF